MQEKLLSEILQKRNFILDFEDSFHKRYIKKIGVLIIQIEILFSDYYLYINKFNKKKFLLYKSSSCNKFTNKIENILDKFEDLLNTIK